MYHFSTFICPFSLSFSLSQCQPFPFSLCFTFDVNNIILLYCVRLKRRTTTYSEKDILLDDSSGFLSNRSSCVDLEVPQIPPAPSNEQMSEKEMQKFEEAMRETAEVEESVVETTDQV